MVEYTSFFKVTLTTVFGGYFQARVNSSYIMSGIPGIPRILRPTLYLLARISNSLFPAVILLLSMVEAVHAQESVGPILSARRFQNATDENGAMMPSIAGIFSNDFGQSCRTEYLKILQNTDNFNQLGSSAATTVMTLIPAMIIFASIPTASIKSLNSINTQLALFTSAMTLGLRIDSRCTLRKENMKNVKDLLRNTELINNCEGVRNELQLAYGSGGLSEIRESVEKDRPAVFHIVLVMLGHNFLQVVLFGILVRALPRIENILFIWACPEQSAMIFNAWLGITAMLSASIRTVGASFFTDKDNEVLTISPLPSRNLRHCEVCSAMAREPKEKCLWKRLKDLSLVLLRYSLDPELVSLVIKHTVSPYSRQYPMLVVLRNSSESRGTITFAIFGLVQAISIVLLTFMFASIWGGSVLWTTLFVGAFMFTIWVSRTASLVVGEYLEHKTGMTVIYFSTEKERFAILRILTAMPGALVIGRSHGYKYWDGHNISGDCSTHESSELKQDGAKVRAAGFVSGVVFGLFVGMGVLLAFFLATLPYNVPFLPHPRDWPSYPVAFIVSVVLTVAFWASYAIQKSQFFHWDYIYDNIENLPTGATRSNDDLEATGGTSTVIAQPKS